MNRFSTFASFLFISLNVSFAQKPNFNQTDSTLIPQNETKLNKIFDQPWMKLNHSLPMSLRLSLLEPSLYSNFALWSAQYNDISSEKGENIHKSVAEQRDELLLSLQRSLKESAEMKFLKQVLTISEGAAAAYLMYEHFRKYKDKY